MLCPASVAVAECAEGRVTATGMCGACGRWKVVLLSGFPVAGAPKLPSMCWKVKPAIRTGVLGSFTPCCGGAV